MTAGKKCHKKGWAYLSVRASLSDRAVLVIVGLLVRQLIWVLRQLI